MSKLKMVRLCELASMNRGNMGSHVGKLATDKNYFSILRTIVVVLQFDKCYVNHKLSHY